MSSTWSLTGQKVLEAFGGHKTLLPQVATMQQEVRAAEQSLTNIKTMLHGTLKNHVFVMKSYKTFADEVKILYPKGSAYRSCALLIVEAYESMEQGVKMQMEDLKKLDQSTKEWFISFNKLEGNQKGYDTVRQKYDHYFRKVADLKKDKDANSAKGVFNDAFEKKYERNVKKFEIAQMNLTQKAKELIQQMEDILYNRYNLINPVILKIMKSHYDFSQVYAKAFAGFPSLETSFDEAKNRFSEERMTKSQQMLEIEIPKTFDVNALRGLGSQSAKNSASNHFGFGRNSEKEPEEDKRPSEVPKEDEEGKQSQPQIIPQNGPMPPKPKGPMTPSAGSTNKGFGPNGSQGPNGPNGPRNGPGGGPPGGGGMRTGPPQAPKGTSQALVNTAPNGGPGFNGFGGFGNFDNPKASTMTNDPWGDWGNSFAGNPTPLPGINNNSVNDSQFGTGGDDFWGGFGTNSQPIKAQELQPQRVTVQGFSQSPSQPPRNAPQVSPKRHATQPQIQPFSGNGADLMFGGFEAPSAGLPPQQHMQPPQQQFQPMQPTQHPQMQQQSQFQMSQQPVQQTDFFGDIGGIPAPKQQTGMYPILQTPQPIQQTPQPIQQRQISYQQTSIQVQPILSQGAPTNGARPSLFDDSLFDGLPSTLQTPAPPMQQPMNSQPNTQQYQQHLNMQPHMQQAQQTYQQQPPQQYQPPQQPQVQQQYYQQPQIQQSQPVHQMQHPHQSQMQPHMAMGTRTAPVTPMNQAPNPYDHMPLPSPAMNPTNAQVQSGVATPMNAMMPPQKAANPFDDDMFGDMGAYPNMPPVQVGGSAAGNPFA